VSGIVIIGAGHAGGSCAGFLRQYGYQGPICLIGSESVPPYQRPPLSKAWLSADMDEDDLYLKGPDFYALNQIDLRLGTTVQMIDAETRHVVLSSGDSIPYEYLVIATGTKLKPLAYKGADEVGYYQLYQMHQAKALASQLKQGARIGIIGTGYIALEVAATAIKHGLKVSVFGRGERLLRRVASLSMANHLKSIHENKGVSFYLNSSISHLSQSLTHEKCLHFDNGDEMRFDLLLAGIGAVPDNSLAKACGLRGHSDIVVDHEARSSNPHIFAIGDVTSRPLSPHYEGLHHLESVPNALEQAKQAAAAIAGSKPPMVDVPWFWSDQYEHKLQIAGLLQADSTLIERRHETGVSFLHLTRDHRLSFAECLNNPSDFMASKLLIAKKIKLDPTDLSERPLKSYLTLT